MKLLVDADACPVVDIALRCAKENDVDECILLCDTSHLIERDGARTIVVSKGADSADFALVNLVKAGDIVVTQDYGLAAMCLAKKAYVLNQNGLIFNEFNIGSLLEQRHLSKKIRMGGGRTKGPSKRTKEQDDAFLKSLKKIFSSIKNTL
ncbi:MAG: YaiI/YqxD family protein [Ruminococcaceae bacterium]|nr:YaiI/YqxD family protein [Oscillospiraceae bacterium]